MTQEDYVDSEAVSNDPAGSPEPFRLAVESLTSTAVRSEIRVESIRPPQRLAPWTYAVSADVLAGDGEELATGRLVLLYDPDGVEAWDGVLRLVAFASAELEIDIATDPLLPEVAWTWLTSGLTERAAAFLAAGGTVTQTTSTRFGDVHGPRTTVSLELRGSWTATTPELGPHLLGFADLLCAAAGLPPEGVSVLRPADE
ncbi:MAG: DUF3000 domain-containing protein [Actinobacteria bacterium]|nr:DUF3000 domain-containing protein [Actinomycetota bacterium]